MTNTVLALRQFSASFADKPILRNISLDVPETGTVLLMGPVGSGKSTLLRTLAGINRASQSLTTSGNVSYCGDTLIADNGAFNPSGIELPAIVAQKTQLLIASIKENIVDNLPERASLTQLQQRELVVRLLQQAGADNLIDQLDVSVRNLPLGQQRLIALVRTMACNPRLVFVDEPTAGVSEADAALIVQFLKQQAEKRAIVCVLHNQQQAKQLSGQVVLLVDGCIVEQAHSSEFFCKPKTELAQTFVRTGSCCHHAPDDSDEAEATVHVPMPAPTKSYSSKPKLAVVSNTITKPSEPDCDIALATKPSRYQQTIAVANKPSATEKPNSAQTQLSLPLNTDSDASNVAATQAKVVTPPSSYTVQALTRQTKSAAFGPRNFLWLLPGKLAGTPRPGLLRDINLDLSALARVGITHLISLESEFPATDNDLLQAHGITGSHLPIADMNVPAIEQAFECCKRVSQLIDQGQSIAFHCKAGLGRTGTLLVAYLIYSGQPAALALTTARAIEPRWVQSARQESFLNEFAEFLAGNVKNIDEYSSI